MSAIGFVSDDTAGRNGRLRNATPIWHGVPCAPLMRSATCLPAADETPSTGAASRFPADSLDSRHDSPIVTTHLTESRTPNPAFLDSSRKSA